MTAPTGTAFYRKENQDSKVVDLLIAAAEFATLAVGRIIHQLEHDEEGLKRLAGQYVDLIYGLEAHFTFLNVGQRDRDLLVSLRKARNAISVEQGGLRQWRTPDQYQQHKTVMETLKKQFLILKAEVQNGSVRSQMTPLQQKILDQEYLSIPASEGSATRMFFNKKVTPRKESEEKAESNPPSATPPQARKRRSGRCHGQPASRLFRNWNLNC
jgi:hypothetical protein